MCIFNLFGCKIEHTVGGHNHDILKQYISDVYASRSMEPQSE